MGAAVMAMGAAWTTVRHFGGIRIDTRDWPLIVWESPAERVPDASSAQALDWIEALWRSTPLGSRSFMVTDLTRMRDGAPASQRKYAADFMERNRELQVRASAGGAIVAPSALARGIITAVFWLKPSPVKSHVVSTREEALLHGILTLESVGEPLPVSLRLLRTRLTLDAH
jgi:hypothetical protein